MRSLPEIVRPWPYLLAGIGFGFLFLAEFGLSTVPLVQAGLVLLAVAGLIGAIRGARARVLAPLRHGCGVDAADERLACRRSASLR